MIRKALLAVVALTCAACGGWGYEANPVDGTGKKSDHPRCLQVYLRSNGHGFLGTSTHYDQEGLYCRVPTDEIPEAHR